MASRVANRFARLVLAVALVHSTVVRKSGCGVKLALGLLRGCLLYTSPNFAEALNNLGNTFKIQDRHAEAAVCYQQALRINPEYAQVHYNHALAQLAVGEFAAGWPEYEWRWRCPDFPRASFSQPLWDGTPLGARTLLVHAEQLSLIHI